MENESDGSLPPPPKRNYSKKPMFCHVPKIISRVASDYKKSCKKTTNFLDSIHPSCIVPVAMRKTNDLGLGRVRGSVLLMAEVLPPPPAWAPFHERGVL